MCIPFQCFRRIQNTKDVGIHWYTEKNAKNQLHVQCRIAYPLKHSGENQPFFHFIHFIFSLYFLNKHIIFWTYEKKVVIGIYFISLTVHTQLTAHSNFNSCQNDVFHISVYLAKVYIEFIQTRDEFPKTHNDTVRCYKKVCFHCFISSPGQSLYLYS